MAEQDLPGQTKSIIIIRKDKVSFINISYKLKKMCYQLCY